MNSTVYGSWNNSYNYQNCYGYSIGQSIFQDPGYYSGSGFSMSLSISSMADVTISDLQSLGYTAYKTTTKPSSLQNFQHVICIRKGSIDYHFMKGISLSLWRHKPGATNPLQWNYPSPGYTTWTNEYSKNNVSYAGTTTYTSTIYYIVYYLSNLGDSIVQDQ